MPDPMYVDDPFGDDENSTAISVKAREGKTPLQQRALKATGRTRFADKKEHGRFKMFEDLSLGADPTSRLWAAWINNRIEIAESYNKKTINMTMPKLLAAIGNSIKQEIWFMDNRENVLKKPQPQELKDKLGTIKFKKQSEISSKLEEATEEF
jgi:hypothetical protein